ncbi:MAG: GWxTD domain-containing protein [Gemmatimonadetes bacterium]|nr:GWxTD domain-containing protein [Gemmatimonadota bacterium]
MKYLILNLWIILLLILPGQATSEVADSLSVLEEAVKVAPKDGDAWVRLGNVYLNAGEIEKADHAFRKGIRYAGSAEAYVGLGRVFMARGRTRARQGLQYFRMARAKDPKSIDAELYLARAKVMLRDLDAEDAFRRVIAMAPDYAPVYLELADWYVNNNFEMYYGEIRLLYEKYLRLRPGDIEALYGLAVSYTEEHNYRSVVEIGEMALMKNPGEARLLALLAQAYAGLGDPDRALELFAQYFNVISAEERALYKDLQLVARPEELQEYELLPEDERAAFLTTFWRRRDLTLISGGLAREAEHYRRVWFARTHFAKAVQPWDRRGEVYIRYGEPDYRSRSHAPNAVPSAEAEAVKERLALDIEGGFVASGEMTEESFFGGVEDEQAVGDYEGVNLTEPAYPVAFGPRSMPWESWIYTQVGGGVEFVFVDELLNGKWQFPPLPDGTRLSGERLSALLRSHPGVVLNDVVASTPEYFDLPPGIEPLAFYYDVARFRGEEGKTGVEVYYGVPTLEVGIENENGHVRRSVVISDDEGEEVFRTRDDLHFGGIDSGQLKKGTFVPDVAYLEVPPGTYRMAVHLADVHSGKWGVYVQDLEAPVFSDSLAMSDLELAWAIGDKQGFHDKYRKGDVWVMPMPSRSFVNDRSVFVYYEVYNLQRDEFGQTRYKVSYTIQQDVRSGSSIFGLLSGGFKRLMARNRKPQVAVSYEHVGRDVWEPIHLELDSKKMILGLNQVEVEVTDLSSGQSVKREAIFRLESPQVTERQRGIQGDDVRQGRRGRRGGERRR